RVRPAHRSALAWRSARWFGWSGGLGRGLLPADRRHPAEVVGKGGEEEDGADLLEAPHGKEPEAKAPQDGVHPLDRRAPLFVNLFGLVGAHPLPPGGTGLTVPREGLVAVAAG